MKSNGIIIGSEHIYVLKPQRTPACAPVKLAIGAIVLLVGRPPRVLLLKLAEQLVHQRVRDAVRIILVGDTVRARR